MYNNGVQGGICVLPLDGSCTTRRMPVHNERRKNLPVPSFILLLVKDSQRQRHAQLVICENNQANNKTPVKVFVSATTTHEKRLSNPDSCPVPPWGEYWSLSQAWVSYCSHHAVNGGQHPRRTSQNTRTVMIQELWYILYRFVAFAPFQSTKNPNFKLHIVRHSELVKQPPPSINYGDE